MLGDHIRALKDGHWLHGIDLGDQRVLYLAEAPGLAPGDRLRRVYRPEFTAGARKVELVVHREPAYPAKAVVARAWSRFMDPSVVSMFRDSEAFAAWCKIGRLPKTAPTAPAPLTPMAAKAAAIARPAPKKAAVTKIAPKGARKAGPARKPAKTPARTSPPGKAAKAPARKPTAQKAASRRAAPAKAARKKALKQAAPAKAARKKVLKQAAPAKAAGKKKARR
jgi:hypothetical protein